MVIRNYFLIALLTALTLGAAVKWLELRSWISPEAQNESRFIRSYDPTPVVKSFRSACSPWGGQVDMFTQVATERSDGAGYVPLFGSHQDVEHHLTVKPQYCGNPDNNAALLTALHEDVLAALRNAACWVSDDRLTLENGLRIAYRCGTRTSGIVAAGPPQVKNLGDHRHLVLSVNVDEHWAVQG
jgi:hypothetical protein